MATSKKAIAEKYHLTPEEISTIEALALRPTCEHCQTVLPPDSPDARICGFECTFCVTCVQGLLGNVCPNCGGGFAVRPIRPKNNWRRENFLTAYPATETRTHRRVDALLHRAFASEIAALEPELR
jgi:hypothetical protein